MVSSREGPSCLLPLKTRPPLFRNRLQTHLLPLVLLCHCIFLLFSALIVGGLFHSFGRAKSVNSSSMANWGNLHLTLLYIKAGKHQAFSDGCLCLWLPAWHLLLPPASAHCTCCSSHHLIISFSAACLSVISISTLISLLSSPSLFSLFSSLICLIMWVEGAGEEELAPGGRQTENKQWNICGVAFGQAEKRGQWWSGRREKEKEEASPPPSLWCLFATLGEASLPFLQLLAHLPRFLLSLHLRHYLITPLPISYHLSLLERKRAPCPLPPPPPHREERKMNSLYPLPTKIIIFACAPCFCPAINFLLLGRALCNTIPLLCGAGRRRLTLAWRRINNNILYATLLLCILCHYNVWRHVMKMAVWRHLWTSLQHMPGVNNEM